MNKSMLANNFKIAFRTFRNNKLFSFINIAGLAIGISASLVIYLIVQYEYSFDKFHKDGDRIYRVVSEIKYPDLTINNSGVPVPTDKGMRQDISGIELQTHFITPYEFKVAIPLPGNQSPAVFKQQKNIIYADQYYFNLFEYTWLAGTPLTALKDPYQVVLTQSRAKTYFGNLSPNDILGKTIIYDDSLNMLVAGIVKDIDYPTDLTFKEFISRTTLEVTALKNNWNWDEWGSINSSSQLFVKLVRGIVPTQIEKQLVDMRIKYLPKSEDGEPDDTKHYLQPLADIHFDAHYDAFQEGRQAHKPTLIGLLAVAAFLLILGCINFINLTTAQASQRAKEIGIRKTMGSGQAPLTAQFLMETFVLTCTSMLVSIGLAPWLIQMFRDFIPPGISFASLNQLHVWLFMAVLTVVVSLLSGFYPAWVLSRFKPIAVLKNQAYAGTDQTRKAWLRKTLTVSQFVITQVILIATLVVGKQVRYSLNKDLGYKKDAIVFFNTEWNIFSSQKDDRRFVLLERLKQIPEIETVSLGSAPPAANNYNTTTMKYKEGDKMIETMVETKTADERYFDLYKMKLLAGENLKNSDTLREFVINETYAKLLGFQNPQDAVGHYIERGKNVPITGVIADFHTNSTRTPIKPLAYSSSSRNNYTIHLALKPRGTDPDLWKRALSKVELTYKSLYPEDDFSYKFFDESIAAFYKAEQNMVRLLKWAAGLCIFISCLGLLGLIIHMSNLRTKEIGVRKVLGASVMQIVTLLSKDFVRLVILAFVIAVPIAWWSMNHWLADFAYRVNIGWMVFAAVGISAVLIAILTVSFQTIKAAVANPVNSLRSE
ncbi:MAG: ABC transporter permease [Saprospiraceae bacterium]|nr:ABC transporter permease [Saprospiraceae bacterium]